MCLSDSPGNLATMGRHTMPFAQASDMSTFIFFFHGLCSLVYQHVMPLPEPILVIVFLCGHSQEGDENGLRASVSSRKRSISACQPRSSCVWVILQMVVDGANGDFSTYSSRDVL